MFCPNLINHAQYQTGSSRKKTTSLGQLDEKLVSTIYVFYKDNRTIQFTCGNIKISLNMMLTTRAVSNLLKRHT